MRFLLHSVLFLGLFIGFATNLVASHPIDRIVAIVDNDVITDSELQKRITFIQKQFRDKELPPLHILQQQVLEMLIQQTMELQYAEKTGISTNPAEIEEEIKQIALQNRLSVSEFMKKIQEEGVTEANFRQQLANELITRHVHQRDVYPSIQVTPKEVEHFMKREEQSVDHTQEYHLGHILVSIPASPTSEQLKEAAEKAKQLLAKLKAGEDFAKIALTYSNDSLALEGGNLGWRKLSEIPSLFSKEVKHMHASELKGPLRSNSGFHIIKLFEVRAVALDANGTPHLPLTAEKAADLLRYQKAQERVANWRRDLRANTFVHISLEN